MLQVRYFCPVLYQDAAAHAGGEAARLEPVETATPYELFVPGRPSDSWRRRCWRHERERVEVGGGGERLVAGLRKGDGSPARGKGLRCLDGLLVAEYDSELPTFG